MVERYLLTPELVDQLVPPERGERWVSDTQVRGFGIRLWGGKNRRKAFAIRVNIGGKITRKSIARAKGTALGYARDIALEELAKLRNPAPVEKSKKICNASLYYSATAIVQTLTFGALANAAIAQQRNDKCCDQYVVDNMQRFIRYTKHLIQKRALDVTAKDLRDALIAVGDKPVQRRHLRSFYTYMLHYAAKAFGESAFRQTADELRQQKLDAYRPRFFVSRHAETLKADDFDLLFEILRDEKEYVQQADFIALRFSLGSCVSLSSLLKARWDEIFIKSFPDFGSAYYVWAAPHRTEWRRWFRSHRLNKDARALLSKIEQRNNREFPHSPFFFPSKREPKSTPMTAYSYRSYWDRIRPQTALPDMALQDLANVYASCVICRFLYPEYYD